MTVEKWKFGLKSFDLTFEAFSFCGVEHHLWLCLRRLFSVCVKLDLILLEVNSLYQKLFYTDLIDDTREGPLPDFESFVSCSLIGKRFSSIKAAKRSLITS